jgi:hypothetical protein
MYQKNIRTEPAFVYVASSEIHLESEVFIFTIMRAVKNIPESQCSILLIEFSSQFDVVFQTLIWFKLYP